MLLLITYTYGRARENRDDEKKKKTAVDPFE